MFPANYNTGTGKKMNIRPIYFLFPLNEIHLSAAYLNEIEQRDINEKNLTRLLS